MTTRKLKTFVFASEVVVDVGGGVGEVMLTVASLTVEVGTIIGVSVVVVFAIGTVGIVTGGIGDDVCADVVVVGAVVVIDAVFVVFGNAVVVGGGLVGGVLVLTIILTAPK
uniref:Uncharacterized protein n=1 Tax=Panagrolaimus davidi TaxID=227884 RepID=A0A914QXB0_9BILA